MLHELGLGYQALGLLPCDEPLPLGDIGVEVRGLDLQRRFAGGERGGERSAVAERVTLQVHRAASRNMGSR